MSEIEAVTRASGAQIILAKLVLAGSANLVCITIVLWLEVSLQNDYSKLGQMVLYCLVPYLVCMTGMLRLVRLQKREHMDMCDCNAWFLCLLGNIIKGNTVVIRNIRNWILVDCICSIRDIFYERSSIYCRDEKGRKNVWNYCLID